MTPDHRNCLTPRHISLQVLSHPRHCLDACGAEFMDLQNPDTKTVASRRARLRFDRSGLNASRYRRKLSNTDQCPDCKLATDSAEHVVLDCPSHNIARKCCQDHLRRYG